MAVVLGVDPHHAYVQTLRESMRAAGVVRPQISGEAVAHVVRKRERFALVCERYDGEHGTENLFLCHPHRVASIREHGWRDVVAAGRGTLAADDDVGALIPRDRKVAEHLLD